MVQVVVAGEAVLGRAEEVARRIEARVARALAGREPPPPLRLADGPSLLTARYGPPDLDESTENDTPRPALVTRLLTYTPERVRAVYVRNHSAAGPPRWGLLGFAEPGTNAVLSPDEVAERMAGRGRGLPAYR